MFEEIAGSRQADHFKYMDQGNVESIDDHDMLDGNWKHIYKPGIVRFNLAEYLDKVYIMEVLSRIKHVVRGEI